MLSQPGIYNALDDFGGFGGMLKANPPGTNANALQAAVNAALQAGGGIVIVPSNDGTSSSLNFYPIAPASGSVCVTIPGPGYQNAPLLICGTGLGTTLQAQASGDVFDINSNGNVFFQDLAIAYLQSAKEPLTGAAFNFNGGQNYGLFRVMIEDCQYPIKFGGTTQAYVLNCWVNYAKFPDVNELRAVQVDGADTMIRDCLITTTANAASNQYGIVIGGVSSATATRIASTQVESFYNGIILESTAGQTTTTLFTNVRVATVQDGRCLSIGPAVYDAKFIGCHFQNPEGDMNIAENIVIDPGSMGNKSIDTVMFDSCTSKTSMDYGLVIRGGENIQILGGTYSGNTVAGIAITGPATEIQINGANCLGISWPAGGAQESIPQQYGIYIVSGQDIQIVGPNCSGTGRSGAPGTGIYINGTAVTDVRIKGAVCSGPAFGNPSSQQYGIYVQGASAVVVADSSLTGNTAYGLYLVSVADVTVNACDLFGNGTTTGGGIYLSGGATESSKIFIADCNVSGYAPPLSAMQFANTLTAVEVSNCAGYNDVGTFFTTAPVNNQPFYGYSYGYYGPVVFYCSGGSVTQIAIDGRNTNLTSGRFVLGPNDSAMLTYTTAPLFLMVGE